MHAFAEHFDLSLSDDKELVAILTLGDQLVTERDFFGLEAARHTRDDRIGQLRKERYTPQSLGENDATPLLMSTAIRSALASSTFVRLTRYVPPLTCTHGSMLSSHRGVIDIILGAVLVVSPDCEPPTSLHSVAIDCPTLREVPFNSSNAQFK